MYFTMLYLAPTVEQSASATCIYTSPFGFPSHLGHHRALSSFLCRTAQFPICYLFYKLTQVFSIQTHVPSVLVSLNFWEQTRYYLIPTWKSWCPNASTVLVWGLPLSPVCCGGIESLCFSQALIFTLQMNFYPQKATGFKTNDLSCPRGRALSSQTWWLQHQPASVSPETDWWAAQDGMRNFPGCTPCSNSVQAAGKHGLLHSGVSGGRGREERWQNQPIFVQDRWGHTSEARAHVLSHLSKEELFLFPTLYPKEVDHKKTARFQETCL